MEEGGDIREILKDMGRVCLDWRVFVRASAWGQGASGKRRDGVYWANSKLSAVESETDLEMFPGGESNRECEDRNICALESPIWRVSSKAEINSQRRPSRSRWNECKPALSQQFWHALPPTPTLGFPFFTSVFGHVFRHACLSLSEPQSQAFVFDPF